MQFHVVLGLNVNVDSFKSLPLASFFSDLHSFPKCFHLVESGRKRDRCASLHGGEADAGQRPACQLSSGVYLPHPLPTYTLFIF